MKKTNIQIRTDAHVAIAVALADVPVPRVMCLGVFNADPQTDRGKRHA